MTLSAPATEATCSAPFRLAQSSVETVARKPEAHYGSPFVRPTGVRVSCASFWNSRRGRGGRPEGQDGRYSLARVGHQYSTDDILIRIR